MISVIIPTYNRYEFVNRAINSVINQTYKDIEIIVVDDCSEDPRYQELSKNKNIKYFCLDKRSGLPACGRNLGIKNSSGEWVAFLDDDDYWMEKKLEKQMETYVKGNFWQVDQNFLRDIIYPIVKNNSLVHDEFFDKKQFPSKRPINIFVGQAFNDKDEFLHPEHINYL